MKESKILKEIQPYGIEDKIASYFYGLDTAPLDEHEEQMYWRWSFCDNLIENSVPDRQIIEALKKRVKEKYGHEISTATGYRDIAAAKSVFASKSKLDKPYLRYAIYQSWLKKIPLLESIGQYKAAAILEAKKIELLGLNQKDNDLPNPDDYGNHNYYLLININNSNGENFKIDLSKTFKMPEEEVKIISDAIQQNMIEQQTKYLTEYLDGDKQ